MQPTEPDARPIEAGQSEAAQVVGLDPSPDDSEVTVVSKKPPQQYCGGGVDWRKVGELLIGRQLGTFRLDRLLGTGGMGAVFQATDLQLDRQVAVKVLHSAEDDPEAARRFRVEAQSAAKLDHQNIARVFHVGQDQGWNYIVLELVEGLTLRQWVATHGPLDLKTAVHLFRQLASALDHAHQRNIIHRDIKPSNVLVTEDLSVKIVDMGLARIQKSRDTTDHESEAGLTLGTFDYIAPEQARDPRQADQQSDLYSLGCTLYFALVGRPPFADSTSFEKILSHSSSPRPSVLAARSDLPLEVDRLVTKLMAARREDRYASARELARDLPQLLTVTRRTPQAEKPRGGLRHSPARLAVLILATTGLWILLSLVVDANWRNAGIRLPEWPVEPQLTSSRPAVDRPRADGPLADRPLGEWPLGQRSPVERLPGDRAAADRSLPTPPPTTPGSPVDGELNVDRLRPGNAGTLPSDLSTPPLSTPRLESLVNQRTTPRLENSAEPSGRMEGRGPDRFKFETPSLFLPYLFEGPDNGREPQEAGWWLGRQPGPELPLAFNFPASPPGGLMPPGDPPPAGELGATRLEAALPASQVTTLHVIPATGVGAADVSPPALPAEPAPRTRPNIQTVATVEQAILELDRYPNVQTIELHFDGPQAVPPLRIPPGALREIEAGPGFRPLLQFVDPDPMADSPRILIESGNLEINGLDFVWETSGENVSGGVASLVGIPSLGRVVLSQCTFTHRHIDGEAPNLSTADQRAWFYYNQVPVSAIDGQQAGLFSLNQCAFRGAAGIANARFAHPARIRLAQCLAVAGSSMFVWGGRVGVAQSPGIELELEQCSLFVKGDLIRVRESSGRPMVPMHLFAQNSHLLAVGESASLIHHMRGAALTALDGEPAEWPVDFVGFHNVYFAPWVMLQTDPNGRRSRATDLPTAKQTNWFQDELALDGAVGSTDRRTWENLFDLPIQQVHGTLLQSMWGGELAARGVDWRQLPAFPSVWPDAVRSRSLERE
jgi:serine/threonine protein kinase